MPDWFGERGLLPSGNHSVQRDPRRLQYATHFSDTTLPTTTVGMGSVRLVGLSDTGAGHT